MLQTWDRWRPAGFNPRPAIARGAIERHMEWASEHACFNPRAREGRDGVTNTKDNENECFNPRAREGRDEPPNNNETRTNSFNPRAREGRD